VNDTPSLLPWLAAPLARGLNLPAHALLLHGPPGVGQFELALAMATNWLCESVAGTSRPCGHCAGCRLMAAHMHPDFHLLLPDALRGPLGWAAGEDGGGEPAAKADKAKPSKAIRIEAVRAAIEWSQTTSSRGGAKVLLVHPAQVMNPSAANALLKTLEEPAGHLRLLLTAQDPEALLPTVRSRCQRMQLELPPRAQALAWLATHGVVEPELLLAATGGQPLEALAMVSDGIDSQAWDRLPNAVARGLAASVADWPLTRLVDALQKLCHDLMCLRAHGEPRYFRASTLAPLVNRRDPALPALAQWAADLTQAARHDEHPWHAGLRTEALVGQGAGLWQTPRMQGPATGGVRGPMSTLGAP